MNQPISKIDITPLVGVALILVIVFMVTSPMMMTSKNMDVDLPLAKTIEADAESRIVISCDRNGTLALDDRQISVDELATELARRIEAHPKWIVVIRADRYLRHQQILELLTTAKQAGARQLAIATLQRG